MVNRQHQLPNSTIEGARNHHRFTRTVHSRDQHVINPTRIQRKFDAQHPPNNTGRVYTMTYNRYTIKLPGLTQLQRLLHTPHNRIVRSYPSYTGKHKARGWDKHNSFELERLERKTFAVRFGRSAKGIGSSDIPQRAIPSYNPPFKFWSYRRYRQRLSGRRVPL
ncbi:hypothetical protein BJ165DRAFT_628805 [Panaeolus papilionaceus]|nr:hypothetical protein BJ165DRAFT_628805 [Panaeolus papilionaceus]